MDFDKKVPENFCHFRALSIGRCQQYRCLSLHRSPTEPQKRVNAFLVTCGAVPLPPQRKARSLRKHKAQYF